VPSAGQPGHWLGPMTRAGWVQPSPHWAELGPAQKIKNKKCVCMNKNNVNLLVYSLTLESGIKIPV